MAVGGAVWAFSQRAMTITAEDYAEDVIEMTEVISERFIIEMVWFDSVSVTAEFVGNGDAPLLKLENFPVVADSETIYFNDASQIDDELVYNLVDETGVITLTSPLGSDVDITADYTYIIGPLNPLDVWIFNYGLVDIEVKVQVKDVTCPAAEDDWIEIPSKGMEQFTFITLDVISKEELNVKAFTKRGNYAYYKYIVP